MVDQKINISYILVTIFLIGAAWIFHEFVHWLTAELMGLDSIMKLNSVSYVDPKSATEVQKAIVSISAPFATILQAVVAFFWLNKKGWNKYVYPLLFMAFYMRLLAGVLNIFMPNDEARVSIYLGLGTFTLSILVSSFLFWLVYSISKRYQLNWKFQLWNFILTSIVCWAIVFGESYVGVLIA